MRAITAGLVATVLMALAGLTLTGLEWSSLATSDAACLWRHLAVLPQPAGGPALQPVIWLGTFNGLVPVFILLLAPAVVSLVLRYRRGDQRLRQQMKWLGLAIIGVLVSIVVGNPGYRGRPGQQATAASAIRHHAARRTVSKIGRRPLLIDMPVIVRNIINGRRNRQLRADGRFCDYARCGALAVKHIRLTERRICLELSGEFASKIGAVPSSPPMVRGRCRSGFGR